MLHTRITSTQESAFEDFFGLAKMESSRFYALSRRDWARFLADPDYHLRIVSDAHVPMGYFGYWEYESIILIDFFILAPEFRGMGIGKSYWEEFTKRRTGPILAAWNPSQEYALDIFRCLQYQPIVLSTLNNQVAYYIWEKNATYALDDLITHVRAIERQYYPSGQGWTSYIGFDWSDQSECRKWA